MTDLRQAAQQALQSIAEEVITDLAHQHGIGARHTSLMGFASELLRVVHSAMPAPQAEPVAWRDPSNRNPGQAVTFDRADVTRWPHIYRQPLYTHPAPAADVVRDAEQWRQHQRVLKASNMDETLTIRMVMRHKGLTVEREGVLTMLAVEGAYLGAAGLAALHAGRYAEEMRAAIDAAMKGAVHE